MTRPLSRALAIALSLSLLPGCMLSRLVDRAFLGVTVRRPTYPDRKTTGVFLLPFTFAIDVATLPIQALLVVILGDTFPFPKDEAAVNAISANEDFQRLEPAARGRALAELEELLRSGNLDPRAALLLDAEGHWTQVLLDEESRLQLMARADRGAAAVCRAE